MDTLFEEISGFCEGTYQQNNEIYQLLQYDQIQQRNIIPDQLKYSAVVTGCHERTNLIRVDSF